MMSRGQLQALVLTLGALAALLVTAQAQASGVLAGLPPDDDGGDGLGPVLPQDSADSLSLAQANRVAFLQMIRVAEGTADPDGYRALFGHTRARPKLFDSFDDHPRIAARFQSGGQWLWTSAAGGYQFMAVSPTPGGGQTRVDTWDRIKRKLRLADFRPEAQDAAALELIRERGAMADVDAGRFAQAVAKVAKEWASLPGAGYGQRERSIIALEAAYLAAGGRLA